MKIMSDDVPSTKQVEEKFGTVVNELRKQSLINMISNGIQIVLLAVLIFLSVA